MYERFYQLRDRPFALSPDPDYLYPSRVHREALDYLRFGIEGHAGFVVITGEIGSGKTTLLQVLLRNLDGNTTVVRLVNTLLTGRELIESMLLDLGVEVPTPTKPAMLRDLARVLVEQRAAGRRVVAVIDEAQNLVARRAGRAADALQPRDREIEADSDRPRRPAGSAGHAGAADARAAAAARHRAVSHRSARLGRDGPLHQPSPEARRDRRADGVSARRHRRCPRTQRRRASPDQRDLRRACCCVGTRRNGGWSISIWCRRQSTSWRCRASCGARATPREPAASHGRRPRHRHLRFRRCRHRNSRRAPRSTICRCAANGATFPRPARGSSASRWRPDSAPARAWKRAPWPLRDRRRLPFCRATPDGRPWRCSVPASRRSSRRARGRPAPGRISRKCSSDPDQSRAGGDRLNA